MTSIGRTSYVWTAPVAISPGPVCESIDGSSAASEQDICAPETFSCSVRRPRSSGEMRQDGPER